VLESLLEQAGRPAKSANDADSAMWVVILFIAETVAREVAPTNPLN
jgi:hypothetical protein